MRLALKNPKINRLPGLRPPAPYSERSGPLKLIHMVTEMKAVLVEEWETITAEEVNREVVTRYHIRDPH